jgi:hypothetical protein
MAYSDFKIETLEESFGITLTNVTDSFEAIPPVEPSEFLRIALRRGMPVAIGKGREKARSEALVLPILLEVRDHLNEQISVFSGPEFTVDRKQGLAGYCDYLMARSPLQVAIVAPVVAIVEAKHEDLTEGIAQCLAEMHAARIYNQKRGQDTETTYGATTSGTAWRFLRLTGTQAEVDLTEYHIREVQKILGILTFMVS